MKLKIDTDEVWPVFFLDKPRNENDPSLVDIHEDFYKEYCYVMQKYEEFQERIKIIYEHQRSIISQQICGYNVPKGSDIDDKYELNTIRATNVAEATV